MKFLTSTRSKHRTPAGVRCHTATLPHSAGALAAELEGRAASGSMLSPRLATGAGDRKPTGKMASLWGLSTCTMQMTSSKITEQKQHCSGTFVLKSRHTFHVIMSTSELTADGDSWEVGFRKTLTQFSEHIGKVHA